MEDSSLSLLYSLPYVLLLLLLPILFLLRKRKQQKKLPPGPLALPIIGHLHLLRKPIHQTFLSFSQKYGPVFSLRFGSRLVVVVSSPLAVEECFTKNDIILSNRPQSVNGRLLTYNNTAMGSANYGDHWRNLRRISAIEIFSTSRLNSFLSIRQDEVKHLLSRLYRVSGHGFAKVTLRPMLLDLTSNILMRMVAGKSYYGENVKEVEEARLFREIVEEIFQRISTFHLGQFIPIFRWVDLSGHMKKVIRLSKKMDSFFQGLIEEHRKDRDRNTMINHFLTLQDSQPEYYTDEIIKGHILVMLLGGAETSATAMEWAIANLLNNPNVLKKAKMEIDTQIGDHLIDEPDFSKLHYLQNIISENLRLYPITPTLVPRMSSADCTVGGYDVPAGTMVLVNAWAIQRDPTLWDDPTSFKPERFENAKVEAYRLIPFGLGRRSCPGDGLANRVMALTLGALIQCFEWERIGENEIDMTTKTMITMFKAQPLEAMCKARPILKTLFP